MSALDDLKDQFRERGQALWERIQESSAYNSVVERYEALPSVAQKTFIAGGIFVAILFLFSIPYSFLDSASQHMTDFEERRTLIRQLLKAGRNGRDSSVLPSGPSLEIIRPQIELALKAANLIPDQIGTINEADTTETQTLVPKIIQQAGFLIRLKKLNLRQVVDIGYDLGKIHPSLKLMGLEVSANRELKNYYDTQYKLVSFQFPSGGRAKGFSKNSEDDQ